MLILSDNSKYQQKKIIIMIIGAVFFFLCGKFMWNNAPTIRSMLNIGFLEGFLKIIGIAAYLMSIVCLVWGIPIYFIVSKGGRISIYDWGAEGAGISGNPYKLKEFKLPYEKLTKAPQSKKDVVYLFSSEGKYTYYASSEANANQIREAIKGRMK